MAALNTVINSMLDKSRGKLIMASAISGTVSAYLHAKKRVIIEDGGHTITNPLITGLNPNVQSYEYYGALSVNQTDEFDTVSYDFSRCAGTLIMSNQEVDENKGASMIFKILKGKMMALEESISRQFSTWHTGTGSGTDPNGLGNLILSDPTSGTVGGINLATESQFRNSAYDFSGTLTAENIEEAFDDMLELDLNRSSDGQASPRPTVGFVGRNIYRMHKAAARDKQVISLGETGTGKALVNLGIVGTMHNKVPLLFDEKLDADEGYFVNEKYLTLHVLRGVNMKPMDLTAPWTVDQFGKRIVWQGQLCSWRQYRTHAYFTN